MSREINILTPENVEVRFELAGIGARFLAILLDSLIQAGVLLVLGLAFWAIIASTHFSLDGMTGWVATVLTALFLIILFVITYGYFLLFEATKNGQTPGKKAIGIRVIRDTGHPVDFRSALLRNLLRIVDMLPSAYLVGIITMFISPQYRRVGDFVAGTLVVKTSPPIIPSKSASKPAANATDSAEFGAQWVASVLKPESMVHFSKITKDDYRIIRHFMDRMNELEPKIVRDYAWKISEPIAAKLHIDKASITDSVVFLRAVSIEWERRMVLK